MKRDPYEVLGLTQGASIDEVRQAYRTLAKKYQSDEFMNGPLSSSAQKKMDELNEAYDEIISHSSNSQKSSQKEVYSDSTHSSYPDVRSLIQQNRLEEAETILDGIYMSSRDAEWYFLKGQIHQRRGWFDEAHKAYSKAYSLDPSNREYKAAFDSLNAGASGSYRNSRSSSSGDCCGCSACDLCSSLICADCCCECFGGDLIKCI